MAELQDKYSDNIVGRYFVDEQCIDCDLCRETAPHNFTRQVEEGYSYVYKQPENEEDEFNPTLAAMEQEIKPKVVLTIDNICKKLLINPVIENYKMNLKE